MLQNAQERHFGGGLFCDVEVAGIYLVRGENLALLGEVVRVAREGWGTQAEEQGGRGHGHGCAGA